MRKLLPEVTSNGEMTFPWKLHMMLEESEREGFEAIVSWQDNYAFKVHDQDRFEKLVMKRFFHQTQFKSFLRQRKYELRASREDSCNHDVSRLPIVLYSLGTFCGHY